MLDLVTEKGLNIEHAIVPELEPMLDIVPDLVFESNPEIASG